MPAIELPPFTETQRRALRSCRFVTTSLDRTHGWAWTDDEETAKTLGHTSSYVRSQVPYKREYEIHITHPDGVALMVELMEERRA
jgi:hypothetical protein